MYLVKFFFVKLKLITAETTVTIHIQAIVVFVGRWNRCLTDVTILHINLIFAVASLVDEVLFLVTDSGMSFNMSTFF